MMTVENSFPKIDGDIWYASEVNGLDSLNIASGLALGELSVTTGSAATTVANATIWILKNTGSNKVHINFGGAATTSNFYLKPNEEMQFQLQQTQLNYRSDALTSSLSYIAGIGSWKRYSNFLSLTATINATSTTIYSGATTYNNWMISNDGTQDVFIRFAATAVTTDFRVKVGETLVFNYPATRLDSISASGTSLLRVFATG